MGKSATTDEQPSEVADNLTAWESRRKRMYKEALREVLIEFGFDPNEPLEIQQDQAWVRRRRRLEESTFVKMVGVIIGAVVTGVVGTVVYAIQRYFNNG